MRKQKNNVPNEKTCVFSDTVQGVTSVSLYRNDVCEYMGTTLNKQLTHFCWMKHGVIDMGYTQTDSFIPKYTDDNEKLL